MPLYMDRHDLPGATAEDVAAAHVSDLAAGPRFGVEFFSYWFDSTDGAVFCFARAPDETAMSEMHAASHGLVPAEIIQVSETDVVRFLGKIHDPADASQITSAFRTIGFTDLVRSTELLDSLGQSEFMVLLTEHDLIIRRALIAWRGREVKHTGDGFLVAFEELDKALRWALAVQYAFDERQDMDVRIGMAAGEPVDHDDDIFGSSVTLASRICSSAAPGRIEVSDTVHDLGVGKGFMFGGPTTRALKGFSQPAVTYELLGSASST